MKNIWLLSVMAAVIALMLVAFVSCSGSKLRGKKPGGAGQTSYQTEIDALKTPPGVDAKLWDDLKNSLANSLAEFGADKRTSAAPTGANGKAVGLTATAGAAGAMTLKWVFRNSGDYDQNGEVAIADITPIALNYLKNTTSTSWWQAMVVDGDGSNEIGIADITPIALSYLSRIDGYIVETSTSATGTYSLVEESPFSDGQAPTGTAPTKNWFDAGSNTAGFGIPDGTTGNITTGDTLFQTNCAGCHSGGKDARTYQQFKDALATIPAMSSITLSDQQVSDITAYSNRNNADPAPNVFDGSGNTSGFGIPALMGGNITAGNTVWTNVCSGCHADGSRDGRTYTQIDTALTTIPAMMALGVTSQQNADVTAYLNRNNADPGLPTDGHLVFTHSVVAPVNNNYYRVTAFEGIDPARTLGDPSDPVQYTGGVAPLPPPPPTGVAASDGTSISVVTVTWTKSAGATGYKVFRDSQAAPIATAGDIATLDDMFVSDTLLHTYWVTALNADGDSDYSTSDTGYLGGGAPGLAPPPNLQASDGALADRVTLTWDKSTGATGYKIYRDAKGAPIDTIGDLAAYDDMTVADSSLHTYWVTSTDGASDSIFGAPDTGYKSGAGTNDVTVFGFNDLGMHVMNQDFSDFLILPPFNTFHAQVVDRRSGTPQIMTGGITVHYEIPGNTHSADKTNFWSYANALLGVNLTPDVGLAGFGLSGNMTQLAALGRSDWAATGIPITPMNDLGELTPYNLATVTVTEGGSVIGSTQAVVPISWEISCDICHTTAGISVGTDILKKHDSLHGTNLVASKPVLCGSCHAQPELNLPGLGGLPTLSRAMHNVHAPRMAQAGLAVDCYACHPGQVTQYLRDLHATAGLDCHSCHGQMTDVADPARTPWVSEPKCSNCHSVAGHEYEEPGKLYRESQGHLGIYCESCHGAPHAIGPTINPEDNVQAIRLQGHSGKIDTCTVCHSVPPVDPFPHTLLGG